MRTLVREELNAALAALRAKGWTLPDSVEVPLERPKRLEHGDLATNLAMLLAKPAGKKPRDVAESTPGGGMGTTGPRQSVPSSPRPTASARAFQRARITR